MGARDFCEGKSGEVWIATKDKVLAARSVHRIPIEQRWGKDSLAWVTGVPWNRYKGCEEADGDMPEGVPAAARPESSAGSGDRVVFVETRAKVPRDF